jgi:hypothetical protein
VDIPLSQGQVATIDDVDADLASLNWSARNGKREKTVYAQRRARRSDGRWTIECIHQVIARRMGIVGPPDHKDRNGLNNRRDNLRPATKGQNGANRPLPSNNVSGYKGVSFHKATGRWRAYITVEGKKRHLGLFADPIDAAKAYDAAALAAFKEFAFLNFQTGSL